jgi:hypothetical protein
VIKTIFTTAIVVAVLNAIGHAGMATWRHFQVRDQAQQLILFGANTPTADLEWQIAQIAEEFEVPVAPEDIVVTRQGARTVAEAYYTMPIELFPRFFYPVDLSFSVESFALNTGVTPRPAR